MQENDQRPESMFTRRRRMLKQAALLGLGVGLAVSPQTRTAADALDSATQATARKAAEKAKDFADTAWEGHDAFALEELPPEQGETVWAQTLSTPTRYPKFKEAKQEIWQIGYSAENILYLKDPVTNDLWTIDEVPDPYSVTPPHTYTAIYHRDTLKEMGGPSYRADYLKRIIQLVSQNSQSANGGVLEIIFETIRQNNQTTGLLSPGQGFGGGFIARVPVNQTKHDGNYHYFKVDSTYTGLKYLPENLSRTVVPAREN